MSDRIFFGIDWGETDGTQIIGVSRSSDDTITVLEHKQITGDIDTITGWLHALNDYWQPLGIWCSIPGFGNPHLEYWQAEKLPVRSFYWKAKSHNLYGDILRDIRSGALQIPDSTVLRATYGIHFDERRYKWVPTEYRSDREKYLVIALSLAWYAARTHNDIIQFV
jgi:hypothetical protein